MEEAQALKHLSKIFNYFQIPYALIGAYAIAAWGLPRATKDIDFVANIFADTIPQLFKKLKSLGFKAELYPGSVDDPLRGIIRLTYGKKERTGFIDIILGIKKMPEDLFTKTKKVNFLNNMIPIVCPEDLIILKLIAGGPLDITDARSILDISKEKIDIKYIKKYCKSKKIKYCL